MRKRLNAAFLLHVMRIYGCVLSVRDIIRLTVFSEEGQHGKKHAHFIHKANVNRLPGSEGVSFAKNDPLRGNKCPGST